MKGILFLLLFIFSCYLAQAQTDTLPGDPSDPNCPCYAVQLRAEKEYNEQKMQQRKVREDSLLELHRKEKHEIHQRIKQNNKRKKKKDCPQAFELFILELYTKVSPVCGAQTGSVSITCHIKFNGDC